MDKIKRDTGKVIKKGILWNSINAFARYGLVFVGTIVLARLLTPEDYGLIGILAVFISVAEVLIDAGLGGAVVKKVNVTSVDYSTLTVYNLLASVIIYISFFSIAPFVGSFYDNSVLEQLLRLYSIVILIHSITIVPRIALVKQLYFKTLSLISLISSISGLVVAIVLAHLGYGVYSLVWQYIINAVVSSVLTWYLSPYRFKFRKGLRFSYSSFKEQFAFGINTTVANSIKSINDNIYANIIGKVSGLTLTGYYAQSYRLSSVPNNFMFSLIDNTFFPIFSQETDNAKFVKELGRLNNRTVCIIVILFGCAIPICKELIFILLGEQWLKAEMSLMILLVSSMFISISNIGRNIMKCKGETLMILKCEIRIFLFAMLLLAITSQLGYYYILSCLLIVSIVRFVLFNQVAYHLISVNVSLLFKPLLVAMAWVAVAVLVSYSISFLNLVFYVSLVFKLCIYAIVMLLWIIIYHKGIVYKIIKK